MSETKTVDVKTSITNAVKKIEMVEYDIIRAQDQIAKGEIDFAKNTTDIVLMNLEELAEVMSTINTSNLEDTGVTNNQVRFLFMRYYELRKEFAKLSERVYPYEEKEEPTDDDYKLAEEIKYVESEMNIMEQRIGEALIHLGNTSPVSRECCESLFSFIPQSIRDLVDSMYSPIMTKNRTDERVRDLFTRYHALMHEASYLSFEYEKYKRHI